MTSVIEFQKKLLTDKDARAEFAADPKKFLDDLGVRLPEGIEVPPTIDLAIVESSIAEVSNGLAEEKLDVADIRPSDTTDVIRVVEDAVPVRTRDLVAARAVHTNLNIASDEAARVQTIAVLGAVVAAVVAVPVATFGRTAEAVSRINPAAGIERVSRGALGITVTGPQGLRVEGLSVREVADLIKTIR